MERLETLITGSLAVTVPIPRVETMVLPDGVLDTIGTEMGGSTFSFDESDEFPAKREKLTKCTNQPWPYILKALAESDHNHNDG